MMLTGIDNEIEMLKKKNRKNLSFAILAVIIVLVLSAILFTIFFTISRNQKDSYEKTIAELQATVKNLENQVARYIIDNGEVRMDVIEAKIQDIGELATIEYLYTDAGKFEDANKIFNVKVAFTTKSFIAKWDGVIKAGIDVDDVVVDIDKSDKLINIVLPKAKILSHEINSDSVETLDQKDGLFNPVKVEDVRTFDAISKEAMEERAIENGILEKATDNAQEIIEKLVYTEPVKNAGYRIDFQIEN